MTTKALNLKQFDAAHSSAWKAIDEDRKKTTAEILARIRRPKRAKAQNFSVAWCCVCDDLDLMPVREYQFDSVRKFRFDFAWKWQRVALEIDGGVWTGGGHTTGTGKTRDCEKDFLATQQGWRVIRWTSEMVGVQNCEKLLNLLKSAK